MKCTYVSPGECCLKVGHLAFGGGGSVFYRSHKRPVSQPSAVHVMSLTFPVDSLNVSERLPHTYTNLEVAESEIITDSFYQEL